MGIISNMIIIITMNTGKVLRILHHNLIPTKAKTINEINLTKISNNTVLKLVLNVKIVLNNTNPNKYLNYNR